MKIEILVFEDWGRGPNHNDESEIRIRISVLTLSFSTSIAGAVNPTVVTGQPNPFVEALVAAMSQEVPGGVAVYQLGNDQSVAAAAPNGVQMYIRTAVFT